MIDWMQRHKKWLVITIWISTIAFVGAGFVGWGSYEMGRSGGSVATVGERNVEYKDLQKEYSTLYNQYQQMFGAQFNNEMAEKLQLEKQALNNLLQKNLLLSLADEIGLGATDEDIAKTLVKYEAFLKDGKFDKAQYQNILKQNRTNSTEFEASLADDVVIQKLTKLYNLSTDDNTNKMFTNIFFAEDKVSIQIVDAKDIKLNYKPSDLSAYYEINKDKYKSIKQYKLNTSSVAINNADEKASKKEALKKYLQLKKQEEKFENSMLVNAGTTFIDSESLQKIFTAKVGEYIKPIKLKDSYLIAQLEAIVEPQTLPFEEVKKELTVDFENELKAKELQQLKDSALANFKGKEIGFVSKENTKEIKGLTKEETAEFINQLFSATTTLGTVNTNNKVIVFKILDTKLASQNKANESLVQNIDQMMNNVALNNLLKSLETKYPMKSYIKE